MRSAQDGTRQVSLDMFEGRWRLSRRIEDRHGPGTGAFLGTALWRRDPDGLVLAEEGELTLASGARLRAERRYLWRAAGPDIAVHYDDGRFFHLITVQDGRAEAVHDCAPDRYEVTYDFRSWFRWETIWKVRGPRKDYVMHSSFVPEGAV